MFALIGTLFSLIGLAVQLAIYGVIACVGAFIACVWILKHAIGAITDIGVGFSGKREERR